MHTSAPVQPAWRRFSLLWIVFFFQGASSGFWLPALTNTLREMGLSGWTALAFAVPPFCSLIAPLIGGALADQKLPADKLYAWSAGLGAIALFAAFAALDGTPNPHAFIAFLTIYSIVSAPTWGLLATLSMTHLSHAERQFPLVRMGATIGWVVAGLGTSLVLMADESPVAGYAGAVARGLGALFACALPHTPPLGRASSWRDLLGLQAFSLFKQRDHLVFFVTTALFSVPLTAFYMYAPELLEALGDRKPTATMTIAQGSEILALFGIGLVMSRTRLKTLLMIALLGSAVRFAMSAWAGWTGQATWHIVGIALHGACFTFYFITAQVFLDRRVAPSLRGQAQGLLGLVSGGFGPLVGAFVCGAIHKRYVTGEPTGWAIYWGILAIMIVACSIFFGLAYRGLRSLPNTP